ncbi:unnamed protein product [Schistocephalus solidus]|uniref:Mitochondrial 28S ribosomal protein S36 n=1 Tax=Schistocephalus solidus TaxID=70667 RepID=A0A183TAL9_SCHSO|nr:unnamed protein product [Schistocephalus solidus]
MLAAAKGVLNRGRIANARPDHKLYLRSWPHQPLFFDGRSPRDIRNLDFISQFSCDASLANSFIPPALDTCEFVPVRHDAVRRLLQTPYKVVQRSDKDFVIDRNGNFDTVSIDRVKPAYVEDAEPASPQPSARP